MDFLNNYFYWGLGIGVFLGLIGIVFAVNRLLETKGEVRRLKRHLADKLELEAEATNRLRQDLQELRQQNENLRIKVANLNQFPDKRLQRELEIYARAERIYGFELARFSCGLGRGEAKRRDRPGTRREWQQSAEARV